jgi:hypothetical protein
MVAVEGVNMAAEVGRMVVWCTLVVTVAAVAVMGAALRAKVAAGQMVADLVMEVKGVVAVARVRAVAAMAMAAAAMAAAAMAMAAAAMAAMAMAAVDTAMVAAVRAVVVAVATKADTVAEVAWVGIRVGGAAAVGTQA